VTIIETAARQGIDLRAYLSDIFMKIAGGWKMSRLDELLPENWRAEAATTTPPAATASTVNGRRK